MAVAVGDSVLVMDTLTAETKAEFILNNSHVTCMEFGGDNFLAVGDSAGSVHLMHLNGVDQRIFSRDGLESHVVAISFTQIRDGLFDIAVLLKSDKLIIVLLDLSSVKSLDASEFETVDLSECHQTCTNMIKVDECYIVAGSGIAARSYFINS